VTSERTGNQQPGYQQPGTTGAEKRSAWRRQARFLGAAFAVAAAVIAVGLRFAPPVTAYAALRPWVFAGLLGFVLVLAGACVLFAASLPATPPGARHPVPPPAAPPWNTSPDAALSQAAAPAAPPAGAPAGTSAGTTAEITASPTHPVTPGRGLTILGSVLGVVGLALAALAVVLTVLLPAPTARIEVQFTDLYGRVQLEYCPSLPGSFAATASQADLAGSSTILPVQVSAETCGNPEYTDGVWIYLNRASVTVSDRL